MRIGFVDGAGARSVRFTRALSPEWASGADASRQRPPLPVPAIVNGGIVFCLGGASAADGLPGNAPSLGQGRHSVERVLDQCWIGHELLLARVSMIDLCTGNGFERWIVADTSARCVAVLWHDLLPPKGGLLRSIRSTDPAHVWLQYAHLHREGEGSRQTEMSDGALLELHRVPTSRLLANYGVHGRLVGVMTCVYAPTLFMLTGGEQSELPLGEMLLVDDVEIRTDGALRLVVVRAACDLRFRANEVKCVYELSLARDGRWLASRLYDSQERERLALP